MKNYNQVSKIDLVTPNYDSLKDMDDAFQWPPLTEEQKLKAKEIADKYLNAPPLEQLPVYQR